MSKLFRCLLQPTFIGVGGLVALLALTAAYWHSPWSCPKIVREDVYHFALFFGGWVGILLAYWRCVTADKNLKQDRYRVGAELLDTRNRNYAARVAGAATLAELAKQDPQHYADVVARAFAAFLAYPPRYDGGPNNGKIDFQSQDTVVAKDALNEIVSSGALNSSGKCSIFFPEDAPFRFEDGVVKSHQDHPDHPD